MFCSSCGAEANIENQSFCANCGAKLAASQEPEHQKDPMDLAASPKGGDHRKGLSNQLKGTFTHAAERLNSIVGEEGPIELNLKDIFSDVLKKHTKEEAEILFTSGTKLNTPKEEEISTSWPKPWLFARVFVMLAITYAFLFICTYVFENTNTLAGVIMVGSFAVPFSLLIFFWETNAPRNISFFDICKMFFIGGASSLVITLLLYSLTTFKGNTITGSIIIGIIEELGKLIIVAYFIKRLNPKYILNGLLIGATVGAGFAAFESNGYAFNTYVLFHNFSFGNEFMLRTLFERAWGTIGTHTVWAAISGAALVYVKGTSKLAIDHFFKRRFLQLFIVPVLLHALWDLPITAMQNPRLIILILVAWVFIFIFINAGLKQIMRLVGKHGDGSNAS